MTRTVARLPATAARSRSMYRGPRRGGGMIFVVSPDGVCCVTRHQAARAMPPHARQALDRPVGPASL